MKVSILVATIIALSLGVGLGLPTQPGLTAQIAEMVRAGFESGISAGGLTAIALNLAWPASPVQKSEAM